MKSRLRSAARFALHPLYTRLETRVHPLRYLFLEITSRCNLACLHCGSDCGRDPIDGELETREWLEVIDSLAHGFDPRQLVVVLTGGEPLCHPELPRFLRAMAERSLRVGLVTNGYLLDERRVKMLVDSGIETMTVSLDGTLETHDWLRGRQGSFDRALAGIELLAKSPIPIFDVVTCANPRNVGELPEVEALLRRAGAKRWRLFSIFPKGRAKGNADLILTGSQIRDLLAWIASRRKALSGAGFQIDFCCEGYLPRRVDRAVRSTPYFCRAGINIASVLCDGSISACPNISRSLVQGNIREHDLKVVWDERFAPFRDRSWMRKGPCGTCRDFGRCQGNSLHLWDHDLDRTVLCHRDAVAG